MNWSTSVLTTTSSDTEPTIVITFASAKYIFNVGENTNRAFLQSAINWRRTRALFFTSIGTQRASGLAGLLMSFADATIPRLDLVGPPGLIHFLASMRSYTFRETMPINPVEFSKHPAVTNQEKVPEAVYKDENISVYAITVQTTEHSGTTGAKRKRTLSPDSPSKRSNVASETTLPSADNSFATDTISDIQNTPENLDFSPESLEGEYAQRWRKAVVNFMFPGSKPSRDMRMEQKKRTQMSEKERSKFVGDPDLDMGTPTTSKKRIPPPIGLHKRLPEFKYPHAELSASVDPSSNPTLAYVIVGPQVRGKFDAQKAKELGIPNGRIRSKLTQGETIRFTVKDEKGELMEKVVRPEDCIGESESPGAILILDVPTVSHIPSLVSSFTESPFYAKFHSQEMEDRRQYAVRAVFHICGDGVLDDAGYRSFMRGFASDAHHLVASRKHNADRLTFTSAGFKQLQLSQLDSEIFPIPKFRLEPEEDIADIPGLPGNTVPMNAHLRVDIRPPRPPIREESEEPDDLFHAVVVSPVPLPLPSSTLEQFQEAKNYVDAQLKVQMPGLSGSDVVILTLGTGSAMPSKYRNVSGTLVQIPGWGNILLDAGEGSWGQLVRHFGPSNVLNAMRSLKCIFISHVHGDHHIGLAKILAKRRNLNPPPIDPLYLVASRSIHLYLREMSDLEDLGVDNAEDNGIITIIVDALHWKGRDAYPSSGPWAVLGDESWLDMQKSQEYALQMRKSLGLRTFKTIDVRHRTRCYGVAMEHNDGWSLVFSGDTMPSDTLVRAGANTTLLIHEASMADDQVDIAEKNGHSTIGQAVDIGRRMNAEHILLTHFSARYPKLPPSWAASPSKSARREPILALAFDHANMAIGSMWKMSHYMTAIQQCFQDTAEETDADPKSEAIVEIDDILV